jgi:hypothetical protein
MVAGRQWSGQRAFEKEWDGQERSRGDVSDLGKKIVELSDIFENTYYGDNYHASLPYSIYLSFIRFSLKLVI